ncbi:MAG: MBL fold metallo-hydrolase, partial [Betaproteobacteria bacterium]|nr:MBL fold metallo-hydrolase [Betaproteobacteria bacterium]
MNPLPQGLQVFERGWLSSNNVLLTDAHSSVLVD